jgi:hypothetical protein
MSGQRSIRRVASLLIALLVVTATFQLGGLAPVQPASAASPEVVGDFESGDLSASGWSGSLDKYHINTTDPLEGSRHLQFNDTVFSPIEKSYTAAAYDQVGLWYKQLGSTGSGDPRFDYRGSGGTNAVVLAINGSGFVENTDISINNGEWYRLTAQNIDYANNEYDIVVYDESGSEVGQEADVAFANGVSQLTDVEINGGGENVVKRVDYVGVGGASALSRKPDLAGTVTDQDGDPVRNATVKIAKYNSSKLEGQYANIQERIKEIEQNITTRLPAAWRNQSADELRTQVGVNVRNEVEEDFVVANSREQWGAAAGKIDYNRDDIEPEDVDPDLSTTTYVYSDSEPIFLTRFDASKGGSAIGAFVDPVDEDWPGRSADGNVTIQQVAGSGEALEGALELETEPYFRTGAGLPGLGKTHEVAIVNPPPGVYKVYPSGKPALSYLIVVAPEGDPDELAKSFSQDQRDAKGRLTEQAEALENFIANGTIAIDTVNTNETGGWEVSSVNSNFETVTVTAYKRPPNMNYSGAQQNFSDVREYFETEIDDAKQALRDAAENPESIELSDPNSYLQSNICRQWSPNSQFSQIGSAQAPTDGKRVTVPNRNVRLQTVGASGDDLANTGNGLCALANNLDRFSAEDLAELLPGLLEDLSDISLDRLDDLLGKQVDIGVENPRVCERTLSQLGVNDTSECRFGGNPIDEDGDGWIGPPGEGIPVDVPLDEIPRDHKEAVSEEIERAKDRVGETTPSPQPGWGGGGGGDVTDPGIGDGDGCAAGFCFPGGSGGTGGSDGGDTGDGGLIDPPDGAGNDTDGDGDPDTISLNWQSGIEDLQPEQVLVTVHLSNGTSRVLNGSSDYVELTDPAGAGTIVQLVEYPIDDVATATVEFEAITPDEVSKGQAGVRNPGFDGRLPDIAALRLSASQPAPGDRVQFAVKPGPDAFGGLTSVTVDGPEGTLDTNISDDNESAAFTVNNTGLHRIRYTVGNGEGRSFTSVVTLRAVPGGVDRPPTIRGRSTTLGVFPVVSDGFESGTLETDPSGETLTAVGVLGEDVSPPSSVHVHSQGLGLDPDHETTVRVVQGASEQQLDQQLTDVLHEPAISEQGFVYREGYQPLPRDGSNEFGRVNTSLNQTVVETYSDPTARVTVSLNDEPGLLDRAIYGLRVRFPSVAGSIPEPDLPSLPGWAGPSGGLGLLAGGLVVASRRWWA